MKLIIKRIKIFNSNKEYIFSNILDLAYKDTNILIELLIKRRPAEFEIEYSFDNTSIDSSNNIERIGENNEIKNFISLLKDRLGINISFEQFKKHIQVLTEDERNSVDTLLNFSPYEQLSLNNQNIYEQEFERVKALLTNDNDKNKLSRYIEISYRINNIEKEIEGLKKNKDNRELNEKLLKDKEKHLEQLKQKVSSTTELLTSKEQLESRYKNSIGSLINNKNIEQLKLDKYTQTINQLENVKREQINNVYRGEDNKEFKLRYKWLLLFIVIEVVVGGYLTILTSSLTTLLASLTILISMILIYITLQIIGYKKENFRKKNKYEDNIKVNVIASNNNLNELETFKASAISNAIKLEIDKVNNLITQQLGGRDIDKINKDIKSLEREIEILKSLNDNNINNQDEMYKKRREVDILKIEKENIDNSTTLKNISINNLVGMYKDNIDKEMKSEKVELELPVFVVQFNHQFDEIVEKYKNIRQVILINEVT